jgi:hypothetical protein
LSEEDLTSFGRVRAAVLCDDIRQEKNNKYILIGVFTGSILVNEMPTAIAPQLYLDFEPLNAGEFPFKVEYRAGEANPTIGGSLTVVAPGEPAILIVPPVLLEIKTETEFEIFLTLGSGPRQRVMRKQIILQASPTASEQPSSQSPSDAPVS